MGVSKNVIELQRLFGKIASYGMKVVASFAYQDPL